MPAAFPRGLHAFFKELRVNIVPRYDLSRLTRLFTFTNEAECTVRRQGDLVYSRFTVLMDEYHTYALQPVPGEGVMSTGLN